MRAGEYAHGSKGFAQLREDLNRLSQKAGEYCGLPPTIVGERLIIEPTHRAYKAFQDLNAKSSPRLDVEDYEIVNRWYSKKTSTEVVIFRENGKLDWGQLPAANHFAQDLRTMGCSIAWSVSAETQAMRKLGELIPDHLWRGYVLTGMFLETSKRSGVTYIFRRLRPTVALRPDSRGEMRILACLCMHPIGYYAESWAGALCPTDDVLTHLLLMRGDEKMFWKRSNQIAPWRPEAGL